MLTHRRLPRWCARPLQHRQPQRLLKAMTYLSYMYVLQRATIGLAHSCRIFNRKELVFSGARGPASRVVKAVTSRFPTALSETSMTRTISQRHYVHPRAVRKVFRQSVKKKNTGRMTRFPALPSPEREGSQTGVAGTAPDLPIDLCSSARSIVPSERWADCNQGQFTSAEPYESCCGGDCLCQKRACVSCCDGGICLGGCGYTHKHHRRCATARQLRASRRHLQHTQYPIVKPKP